MHDQFFVKFGFPNKLMIIFSPKKTHEDLQKHRKVIHSFRKEKKLCSYNLLMWLDTNKNVKNVIVKEKG